jgi:hypothetical protein
MSFSSDPFYWGPDDRHDARADRVETTGGVGLDLQTVPRASWGRQSRGSGPPPGRSVLWRKGTKGTKGLGPMAFSLHPLSPLARRDRNGLMKHRWVRAYREGHQAPGPPEGRPMTSGEVGPAPRDGQPGRWRARAGPEPALGPRRNRDSPPAPGTCSQPVSSQGTPWLSR